MAKNTIKRMNPKINYIVACQYASADKTGKLNAFGIFDTVKLGRNSEPKVIAVYTVGQVSVSGPLDGEEVTIGMNLVNAFDNNDVLGKTELKGNVRPDKDGVTKISIAAFLGFSTFRAAGLYTLNIYINGNLFGTKENFISVIAE